MVIICYYYTVGFSFNYSNFMMLNAGIFNSLLTFLYLPSGHSKDHKMFYKNLDVKFRFSWFVVKIKNAYNSNNLVVAIE